MGKDKKEYLRQYYLKNKERLNEAKKLRYRTDPEYKKKIRYTALQHRISCSYLNFPRDHNGERLRSLKEISLLLRRNYYYLSVLAKTTFPPPYKKIGMASYYTKVQVELLQFLFSWRGLPYTVLFQTLHKFWNTDIFRKEEVRLYAHELKREDAKRFKEQSPILSRNNSKHG